MNKFKSNLFYHSKPTIDSGYYFLLFIIWPFLAFLTALYNFHKKESRIVIYLFFIYYGLTFVLPNIGADAEEYARRLYNYSELSPSEFIKNFKLYTTDLSVDIIQPLLTFIISRITNQHQLLFGVFAALFGFFYLKSILLLYNEHKGNFTWNTGVFIVFFILILPITSINGFRMWTATWIFFLGAYNVILHRNLSYLLLTLSASFVHFSFFYANAVLIIYLLIGNKNIIYIPLAILSFIIPNFLGPAFSYLSFKLGGALQNRYEMYSNEEYVLFRQEVTEKTIWYLRIIHDLLFYYFVATLIVIFVLNKKSMKENREKNLISFLILFVAFVNFAKIIPSFGVRFQVLFFLFSVTYILFYFLKLHTKNIHVITIIGFFPMLLYSAFQIRNGSDSFNTWLLTPGFGLPFFVEPISIAEIIFD